MDKLIPDYKWKYKFIDLNDKNTVNDKKFIDKFYIVNKVFI